MEDVAQRAHYACPTNLSSLPLSQYPGPRPSRAAQVSLCAYVIVGLGISNSARVYGRVWPFYSLLVRQGMGDIEGHEVLSEREAMRTCPWVCGQKIEFKFFAHQ